MHIFASFWEKNNVFTIRIMYSNGKRDLDLHKWFQVWRNYLSLRHIHRYWGFVYYCFRSTSQNISITMIIGDFWQIWAYSIILGPVRATLNCIDFFLLIMMRKVFILWKLPFLCTSQDKSNRILKIYCHFRPNYTPNIHFMHVVIRAHTTK